MKYLAYLAHQNVHKRIHIKIYINYIRIHINYVKMMFLNVYFKLIKFSKLNLILNY